METGEDGTKDDKGFGSTHVRSGQRDMTGRMSESKHSVDNIFRQGLQQHDSFDSEIDGK